VPAPFLPLPLPEFYMLPTAGRNNLNL